MFIFMSMTVIEIKKNKAFQLFPSAKNPTLIRMVCFSVILFTHFIKCKVVDGETKAIIVHHDTDLNLHL